jgi:hypothetical protein
VNRVLPSKGMVTHHVHLKRVAACSSDFLKASGGLLAQPYVCIYPTKNDFGLGRWQRGLTFQSALEVFTLLGHSVRQQLVAPAPFNGWTPKDCNRCKRKNCQGLKTGNTLDCL